MLGLRFDTCNEFSLAFSFENCRLDHASFYRCRIPSTFFKNSQLIEVDFCEADATNSVFDDCNLAGAAFERTCLDGADFTTSVHYSIDPEANSIKKAMFSLVGLPGLLDKYDIKIV